MNDAFQVTDRRNHNKGDDPCNKSCLLCQETYKSFSRLVFWLAMNFLILYAMSGTFIPMTPPEDENLPPKTRTERLEVLNYERENTELTRTVEAQKRLLEDRFDAQVKEKLQEYHTNADQKVDNAIAIAKKISTIGKFTLITAVVICTAVLLVACFLFKRISLPPDTLLLSVPVGTIVPFAGDGTNLPESSKWHVCDGTLVSRTEYADLFKVIQVAWGEGDKTTTFNLPDLRGQFLRGVDQRTKDALDPSAPRVIGSLQSDELPEHTHDVSDLRVAGGLFVQDQHKLLYVNSGGRRDKLSGEFRTFWNGGEGEKNSVQLHGGDTTVETIGLLGSLGGIQQKHGESRPVNRAVQYLIRIKP